MLADTNRQIVCVLGKNICSPWWVVSLPEVSTALWPAEHMGRTAAQIINRQQPERDRELGELTSSRVKRHPMPLFLSASENLRTPKDLASDRKPSYPMQTVPGS